MTGPKDIAYIVDDEGELVGEEVYRADGKVDSYTTTTGFAQHSHDVFEDIDEYMDEVTDAFAGNGMRGSVYSRKEDEDSDKHPWR